jgi:hypothetical protein
MASVKQAEFQPGFEGADTSVTAAGAQHTFDLIRSIRRDLVVDRIEAFASWVRTSF